MDDHPGEFRAAGLFGEGEEAVSAAEVRALTCKRRNEPQIIRERRDSVMSYVFICTVLDRELYYTRRFKHENCSLDNH